MAQLLDRFLASKTDLLDVRPCATPFISGAVHISIQELAFRAGELPRRNDLLRVANTGSEAHEAVKHLTQSERSVLLEPVFSHVECTQALRLWEPNAFLLEMLARLEPGNAVDLGCGVGREAVAMAACGWQVQAIDNLADALERAKRLEIAYLGESRVDWALADLEKTSPPAVDPPDLITSFFFLDLKALVAVARPARTGASIILEAFSTTHRTTFGKPRREALVLTEESLCEALPGWEMKTYEEAFRIDGRHTARAHLIRS